MGARACIMTAKGKSPADSVSTAAPLKALPSKRRTPQAYLCPASALQLLHPLPLFGSSRGSPQLRLLGRGNGCTLRFHSLPLLCGGPQQRFLPLASRQLSGSLLCDPRFLRPPPLLLLLPPALLGTQGRLVPCGLGGLLRLQSRSPGCLLLGMLSLPGDFLSLSCKRCVGFLCSTLIFELARNRGLQPFGRQLRGRHRTGAEPSRFLRDTLGWGTLSWGRGLHKLTLSSWEGSGVGSGG